MLERLKRNLSLLILFCGAGFFLWAATSPLHSPRKAKAEELRKCVDHRKVAPRSFVVFIYGKNAALQARKNIRSVFEQVSQYSRVVYIDHASTDGTVDLLFPWFNKRLTVWKLREGEDPFDPFYEEIQKCRDDDIVVVVNGKDWLAHEKVLTDLAYCYEDSGTWMAYGNHLIYPQYKKGKIHLEGGRKMAAFPPMYSGLAKLFKEIKRKDLKGAFQEAIFFPAKEMAGEHTRYVRDILLIKKRREPDVLGKRVVAGLPSYSPIEGDLL